MMRCPSCFDERWDQIRCLQCGYSSIESRDGVCLPVGTSLRDGEYLIGRVLGRPGGFGITYLAIDTRLDMKVAVKEYLPLQMAARSKDGKIISVHTTEYSEGFKYGMEKFLEEARVLAQFRHPNIVRVMNFFLENGTAYMVMDFLEGQSLAEYLVKVEKITGPDAVALFAPVLDGVAYIHARNFIHRDIKPSNLYLTHEGQLILLDFGSARQHLREKSQSMTAILSPGYAPWEQYHRKGKQGPWTDVYACAATLYTMVTGQAPLDGAERAIDDDLVAVESIVPGIDASLAKAINTGMAINPEARPQTAGELQALLLSREDIANKNDGPKKNINEKIYNDAIKNEQEEKTQPDSVKNEETVVLHVETLDGVAHYKINAPVTGQIISVPGNKQQVSKGMTVLRIKSLTEDNKYYSISVDCDGFIDQLNFEPGDKVDREETIMLFHAQSAGQKLKPENNNAGIKSNKSRNWWIAAGVIFFAIAMYINGPVTWTSSDGTYSGQVSWGKRHGMGTLIAKDGTRYTSNWVAGYAQGPGEVILPDGKKLKGNFNMKENTVSVQLDDGSKYEGGFDNNKFNGSGTLVRPNGAKYAGGFRDGKKSGTGILTMPDGAKYNGIFQNDELNGKVEIIKPSGEVVEGEYNKGKQNGEFRRYPSNNSDDAGLVFVSTWKNGVQVRSEEIKASISISNMRVGNNKKDGTDIIGWGTRFPKSEIRYMSFEATVSRDSPNPIYGEILVKSINPNGTINQNPEISPYGGSYFVKISYPTISGGWGNPNVSSYDYGRHYIQLLWKGIKIGETYFDVY